MAEEPKVVTPVEPVEPVEPIEPVEPPVETLPVEPTESLEERVNRLEEEKDTLAKERDRAGYKQRTLEDQLKANQLEMDATRRSEKAPTTKLFEGLQDDDPLTAKEAREAMELAMRNQRDETIVQFDMQRQVISETLAKSRHTDYDEVMDKYKEMARSNPSLERIAYFDPDPSEYRYQKGLDHSDLKAKRIAEEKGQVVKTITKPRPRIPRGGGGGGKPGGLVTSELVADYSPSELKAFKDKDPEGYLRVMKELGEAE